MKVNYSCNIIQWKYHLRPMKKNCTDGPLKVVMTPDEAFIAIGIFYSDIHRPMWGGNFSPLNLTYQGSWCEVSQGSEVHKWHFGTHYTVLFNGNLWQTMEAISMSVLRQVKLMPVLACCQIWIWTRENAQCLCLSHAVQRPFMESFSFWQTNNIWIHLKGWLMINMSGVTGGANF